jgi:hypothetical protein
MKFLCEEVLVFFSITNIRIHWEWWLVPIIPATKEAETEDHGSISASEKSSRDPISTNGWV